MYLTYSTLGFELWLLQLWGYEQVINLPMPQFPDLSKSSNNDTHHLCREVTVIKLDTLHYLTHFLAQNVCTE